MHQRRLGSLRWVDKLFRIISAANFHSSIFKPFGPDFSAGYTLN